MVFNNRYRRLIDALHNLAFLFPVARKRGYGYICFKMAAKCAYFGCSNRMYETNGNRTGFTFWSIPCGKKKLAEFGKIGCPERCQGRTDLWLRMQRGFVSVHFQQSDIVRVPGGSRFRLKIGTLSLKWNQRPAGEQKKWKAPKTEVNHVTSCTSQQTQGKLLKVKQDLSLHHNFIP